MRTYFSVNNDTSVLNRGHVRGSGKLVNQNHIINRTLSIYSIQKSSCANETLIKMMSYLRPINLQPSRLEILCQDSWLSLTIILIKRNFITESEDGDESKKYDIWNLRQKILTEYIDFHLPARIQEITFLRGIQVLRNELSCNGDLFPNFFRLFWRRGFINLHLPQLLCGEDRISALEFLVRYPTFSKKEDDAFLMVENAKFRLFDRSGLNIEESYLMKRVLRMLPYLRHCILWKSCDDAMLHIIGDSCPFLETLDLWRSINVSDSGIKGLLHQEGKVSSTLKRIVLKDTSVTVMGALEVIIRCSILESMDLNRGDVIQEFFNMIGKKDRRESYSLKSLFLPIGQGKRKYEKYVKILPQIGRPNNLDYMPLFKKLSGNYSAKLDHFEVRQLTTLKIEAMHAQVPLNSIGENCPNLEEFHVINARIFSSVLHKFQYSNSEYEDTDHTLTHEKSALHCLLYHAQNLEVIQATGSQDLSDDCLKSILCDNPFKSLKKFMLTSPFTFSSDPPQVPLVLTSSSVILLVENCPNILCIGDLRHWNIFPAERKVLIKRAQGSGSTLQSYRTTTAPNPKLFRSSSIGVVLQWNKVAIYLGQVVFEILNKMHTMNLQSSEENPGCKENRTDPEEIEGLERCYALDTAALMGGNEYLVFEIIDKLTQCTYNKEESLALKWALSKLWTDEEGTNEFLKTCDLNQGHLLDFFTPQMKESLPRIVATGLLFSGRYDDTKVYQNIDDPNNNVIALNMMHHNFESPIGKNYEWNTL
ncbi:FBXL4 [Lepeophtheirus salmonis]|uniref:FBXL4 n=1 Tax=Lepeophtheirus salmonis TaxID=72036 RepID=A0A7R8H2S7_LEPSM|nr:FBXL4 [Lepeophtheirus salmonis]CAF2829139.1 FBXL4 [Lepeophtheirus salmonis]